MNKIIVGIIILIFVIGINPLKDRFNTVPKTASITNSVFDNYKEPGYISPINISYLKNQIYSSDSIKIEEELKPGSNYKQYLASYISEGNKIYGLLTIPESQKPENGYKAIVFVHGYIPPKSYKTTEKYLAYVDYLAKNGFAVFKIDLRGHGNSGGVPAGSYFSPGYTVDTINALKGLQKTDSIDPNGIGVWGHSMGGNVVLRAMEVSDQFKAGVIWAGAVYSYEDFKKYGLNDSSYVPNPKAQSEDSGRDRSEEVQKLRDKSQEVDFDTDFWKSISLTSNIDKLQAPIQLHQAKNDTVVNIGYQRDLVEILKQSNKVYEDYEYDGGGHNLASPYFEEAMKRTVDFYKKNL